jgi:hypothetical protein
MYFNSKGMNFGNLAKKIRKKQMANMAAQPQFTGKDLAEW